MTTATRPGGGPAVLAEILAELPAFWGERDLRALHHPLWWRQFAADALIVREDGLIQAYLAGVVLPADRGPAYIHLVATRLDRRGRGLARLLYETFMVNAVAAGADRVEAVTTPANTGSIAFHRSLGFDVELIADYAGPGQPRTLFRRALP